MAPPNAFLGLLHRAAPRLTRDLFVCRRCLHQQAAPRSRCTSTQQSPFLEAFRSRVSQVPRHASTLGTIQRSSSPLGSLSRTISKSKPFAQDSRVRKSSFPETSNSSVAYWLLGSAASVFGLVIFGGLTRLTESGSVDTATWKACTDGFKVLVSQNGDQSLVRYLQ